jgi:hypothetical protein
MLNVLLDHNVVLGWIEIVGGKFYSTMESVADEFDLLAKGSIVFKHFSLVLHFDLSWSILNDMYGTVIRVTCHELHRSELRKTLKRKILDYYYQYPSLFH